MKSILFISPVYFNYSNLLIEEFKKRGFDVDFFSDRPNLTSFEKALQRKFPLFVTFKVKTYVREIIKEAKKNYEKVIVILGQSFSSKDIQLLKKNISSKEWVYYTWDSMKNFNNISKIYKLFDRSYSFDKKDCEKHKDLIFLPLFYYKKSKIPFEQKENVAVIITTIKKGKFKLVKSILQKLNDKIEIKKYLFLQSKLVFFYFKIFDRNFRGFKINDFEFKRLDYQNVLSLMENSKFVIDIPMANQNGLTMRTFEALALQCKLITSNDNIKDYEFYNSNNIAIFPNDDLNSFLNLNKFIKIDLSKYSIDNFTDTLLCGK